MLSLAKMCCGVSVALFFVACSNTEFQGNSKKPSAEAVKQTEKPNVTKVDDEIISETFSIDAKQKSLIDIVWAVDNSASMNEEATQVKKNLEAFIDGLSQHNNVRLALMSATEQLSAKTGVTLSEKAKQAGHIQLDGYLSSYMYGIGSTNALVAISAAVGHDPTVDLPMDDFSLAPLGHEGYQDTLKDFFRDGAKTVFVIVTDDDAWGVTHENFLDQIKGKVKDEFPVVYGFVGTSDSTCNIARRGLAYEALAQKTNGQVYDLCKADWKEHFSKLTDHVETMIASEFILQTTNIHDIQSVEVDGTALTNEQYVLSGQKLVIKEGVLLPSNKSLKVTISVKS